ncbi:MAG TPA: DUF2218 domain-containing protein [Propionibacteriaceae bacterium]|jgi:hypothetical protein|nr:DUF2218 domain-containing protein [Propionibacteriaceae bacterium]
MSTATAFVATQRPQRYIKQLVSHFGNKVRTEVTDTGGRLEFDFGSCDLHAAPSGIELIGTADNQAQLETLRTVLPGT